MIKNKIKGISFGEILWDVFPEGKEIGGAPLNVAFSMQNFHANMRIISAIGNDKEGEEIKKLIENRKINTGLIQICENHPTGTVKVNLDENRSATYQIMSPSAWDYIVFYESYLKEVSESDVLIYGSLSCRNEVTKNTLFKLLNTNTFKVFDVNLRPPHYNFKNVYDLMEKSDLIKFNEDELSEIVNPHIKSAIIEDKIKYVSSLTDAKYICVTKGGDGAVLFHKNAFYHNPGYKIKTIDTVGAGDSFLASLIISILSGEELQKSLNHACATGAFVAGRRGATPPYSIEEIQNIMNLSQAIKSAGNSNPNF